MDTINIFTLVIAILTLVFAIFCWTYTKLGMSYSYQADVMNWYKRCISVMIKIIHSSSKSDIQQQLLGELSALIDEGRFFFPNIIEITKHGKKVKIFASKPFEGLRCYILDYLVEFYNVYKYGNGVDEAFAADIHRAFTEEVYDFIKPHIAISSLSRKLGHSYKVLKAREHSEKAMKLIQTIKHMYKKP